MSSLYRRLHGLFTTSKPSTAIKLTKPKTQPTTPKPSTNNSKEKNRLKTLVNKFKNLSGSGRFLRQHESLVYRLAYSQQYSLIQDFLDHQKTHKSIVVEGFTAKLITLYGKAGMLDHARKLFDEMPELKCERTVMSLNALLSACVNSKKFDTVDELFRELPSKLNIEPDIVTYNTVIRAMCVSGNLDSAVLMLGEMEKEGMEANLVTFNTFLDAFYKNDRFEDGEKIWEMMEEKNVVPNIRSYNAKLRGLASKGRMSEAIELIEELKGNGLKPDVFSYNALISGFCSDGNFEEAKKWYKKLSKCGISPDRATFTILVPFLCEKGDYVMALEISKKMIERRLLVGTEIMQLVVNGLVKESKIEEATELVELGKSNGYFTYKLDLKLDLPLDK